jgi:hypothetical protein
LLIENVNNYKNNNEILNNNIYNECKLKNEYLNDLKKSENTIEKQNIQITSLIEENNWLNNNITNEI